MFCLSMGKVSIDDSLQTKALDILNMNVIKNFFSSFIE